MSLSAPTGGSCVGTVSKAFMHIAQCKWGCVLWLCVYLSTLEGQQYFYFKAAASNALTHYLPILKFPEFCYRNTQNISRCLLQRETLNDEQSRTTIHRTEPVDIHEAPEAPRGPRDPYRPQRSEDRL